MDNLDNKKTLNTPELETYRLMAADVVCGNTNKDTSQNEGPSDSDPAAPTRTVTTDFFGHPVSVPQDDDFDE